jgi:hypothetical protein
MAIRSYLPKPELSTRTRNLLSSITKRLTSMLDSSVNSVLVSTKRPVLVVIESNLLHNLRNTNVVVKVWLSSSNQTLLKSSVKKELV